jgi:predicted DNA-binding transcriptional regulator AlpA
MEMTDTKAKAYLSGAQVRLRYSCTDMTIWRWVKNPDMGFPQPLKIGGRNRFALDELEAFERKLKTSQMEAA